MRIEQLTFTRFIAAIAIVIFHYFPSGEVFINDYFNTLIRNANVGVSYFFILSGFVMMIAYGNKQKIEAAVFFKNRFSRIYPLYFLSIVFLLLVAFPMGYSMFDNWICVSLNVLALQAWFPPEALCFNYPGWSVVAEFFFYALFPLLFNKVYKKYNMKYVIIGILIFWVISQLINTLLMYELSNHGIGFHLFLGHFPLLHLNAFLIGNVLGYVVLNSSIQSRNYDFPILVCVILITASLELPYQRTNGLLAIVFVPFIFLLSKNTGIITRFFNYKPCVFLGEMSYALYIIQWPVNIVWNIYLLKHIDTGNSIINFWLFILFAIIFSALVHVCIEKPLREKINAWNFSKLIVRRTS